MNYTITVWGTELSITGAVIALIFYAAVQWCVFRSRKNNMRDTWEVWDETGRDTTTEENNQ